MQGEEGEGDSVGGGEVARRMSGRCKWEKFPFRQSRGGGVCRKQDELQQRQGSRMSDDCNCRLQDTLQPRWLIDARGKKRRG